MRRSLSQVHHTTWSSNSLWANSALASWQFVAVRAGLMQMARLTPTRLIRTMLQFSAQSNCPRHAMLVLDAANIPRSTGPVNVVLWLYLLKLGLPSLVWHEPGIGTRRQVPCSKRTRTSSRGLRTKRAWGLDSCWLAMAGHFLVLASSEGETTTADVLILYSAWYSTVPYRIVVM
jgi:hypothetical protein